LIIDYPATVLNPIEQIMGADVVDQQQLLASLNAAKTKKPPVGALVT
jgi:hypothetical protein